MNENKDKITPESVQGKFLFFYPTERADAETIVSLLQGAGFKTREKAQTQLTTENILQKGIGVMSGEFFCDPNRDFNGAALGNWLCTMDQIDRDYLPPDQRFMLDLFNKLSDRIDALSDKIDRIEQQVGPQTIEKKRGLPRKPGA